MKPLCEVVVREILPAVRSVLAKKLSAAGLGQKEIAEKLLLTQPAVSHYLKESRAKNAKLLEKNPSINKLLDRMAKDLQTRKQTQRDVIIKFCDVCRAVRKAGLVCKFHREQIGGLEKCDVCLSENICS